MLRVALFSCLVAVCVGQASKPLFDKKVCTLGVTFFIPTEVAKVTSCLEPLIYNCSSIAQIKSSAFGCLFSACPMSKYMSALSLLGNMDSCLKPTGIDTMGLVDKVFPLATPVITKAYNALMVQIKNAKAAKKTKAQVTEVGYKFLLSAVTKPLIQQAALKMCPGMNKTQWNCFLTVGKQCVNLAAYTDLVAQCAKLTTAG